MNSGEESLRFYSSLFFTHFLSFTLNVRQLIFQNFLYSNQNKPTCQWGLGLTPFFASSSLSFARKPILGSCTWPPKSGFRSSGQESPHSRPVLLLNLCSKPNDIQIICWLSNLTIIYYTQYLDTNSWDAEGIDGNGKIKLRLEKLLDYQLMHRTSWLNTRYL